MKILLVALNHKPEQTGIGKYQGEMAAWLVARGHEVRVVTAPPYYPQWMVAKGYRAWLYRIETIDGAKVIRVPLYVPSRVTGTKRLVHLASFALSSFPAIITQALFWRPDSILLTEPPLMAAPAVLIGKMLAGAQAYLHVQDLEVDAAFRLGLLKTSILQRLAFEIEGALLRCFAMVSTISPKMLERLRDKGVAKDRSVLAPNWANVGAFDPAKGSGVWREFLGCMEDSVLVLYSGNLGHKQGLDTIVEAARHLQENKKIRFIISGDGVGRAEMEARAKGVGNLVFLPVQAQEEFSQLMVAADIHLLPQKKDAADLVMPSKLGNILASGRPVVAGAMPGTQIYDSIQGCGLAVPPEDAEAFAAAIQKLAEDSVLRESMGKEARVRALSYWSQDVALKKIEEIITQ